MDLRLKYELRISVRCPSLTRTFTSHQHALFLLSHNYLSSPVCPPSPVTSCLLNCSGFLWTCSASHPFCSGLPSMIFLWLIGSRLLKALRDSPNLQKKRKLKLKLLNLACEALLHPSLTHLQLYEAQLLHLSFQYLLQTPLRPHPLNSPKASLTLPLSCLVYSMNHGMMFHILVSLELARGRVNG